MHVDLPKKNSKYVASILDYLAKVHAKINAKFPVLITAHCLKYYDSKIHFRVVVIYILSNELILRPLHSFLHICTFEMFMSMYLILGSLILHWVVTALPGILGHLSFEIIL